MCFFCLQALEHSGSWCSSVASIVMDNAFNGLTKSVDLYEKKNIEDLFLNFDYGEVVAVSAYVGTWPRRSCFS